MDVTGAELEGLYAYHDVPHGDVRALRRRMLFEGSWYPAEVVVRGDTIAIVDEPRQ